MNFRTASLLAAASAFVLIASGASAQLAAPIPKPSDRKAGELEGWSDTAKPGAKKDKAEAKKPVAAAKTGRAAKAEKPVSERSQDGGIPLPNGKQDPNDYAPVGFDKDGKLGTGMKF